MATVTVTSEKINTKSGNKNGKDWTIREQDAVIETKRMRSPWKISLGRDQLPYKPGVYDFDAEDALKVSDFGSLQLMRDLVLVPRLAKG